MSLLKNIILLSAISIATMGQISCAGAELDLRSALDVVESRRGLTPLQPIDSRLADSATVTRLILKELDRGLSAEEMPVFMATSELFGLLPPFYPYRKKLVEMFSSVSGLYMPYQHLLILRDNLNRTHRKSILVHEVTHALQDQHFELGKRFDDARVNGDLSYALRCLAEGDATVVSRGGAKWLDEIADPVAEVRGSLAVDEIGVKLNLPASLVSQMANCYTLGVGFVDAVYRNGGWLAVNRAFENVASTEQIIHPAKLYNPACFDKPTMIDSELVGGDAFEGCNAVSTNVHGEYLTGLILRQKIRASEAERAASGWDGDRYWVFETGSEKKSHFYVWLTIWDSENDTAEFVEALDLYFEKKYPAAGVAHGIGETEKTYFGRYTRGRRVLVFDKVPRPLLKEVAALKEKLLQENK